ncbi:hypothetical protein G4G28_16765 [Massilia sp. Dwa41.01b]|uniref:hypothetical protein n=1 Tax=Massilia sp. Dwa41.01b TaxID=2709302 RepID=UPI00160220C0|nr:hypothetical protein [Massilia sp. Dwa41.01b]QNA89714.1 hypothetical protein G4G28_16765 [Massilia sp. Dwa41.01b]
METTPGTWLARLQAWWNARRPRRLDELIAVEFDANEARVIALDTAQAEWTQRFGWRDISRVCFQDEGIYASDILVIELGEGRRPVIVPMEARGADALLARLIGRGHFPEQTWRAAMGETGGAVHCWPPRDA